MQNVELMNLPIPAFGQKGKLITAFGQKGRTDDCLWAERLRYHWAVTTEH